MMGTSILVHQWVLGGTVLLIVVFSSWMKDPTFSFLSLHPHPPLNVVWYHWIKTVMNTSFPVHIWAMDDPNTLQIGFIFLNTVLRSWIKGTAFLSNFYTLLFMFDLISQDQNNDEKLISCSYMNFGSSKRPPNQILSQKWFTQWWSWNKFTQYCACISYGSSQHPLTRFHSVKLVNMKQQIDPTGLA